MWLTRPSSLWRENQVKIGVKASNQGEGIIDILSTIRIRISAIYFKAT
jgi:hypothetical protein